MLKQTIKEALLLVLAAMAIAVAVYAVRPDKIGSPRLPANPSAAVLAPAGEKQREIDIEAAWRLFQSQTAIFADARHRVDFDAGHIQGAVNLYAADPDAWLSEFLSVAEPLKPIVTYCDGEECALARELAELLSLNGFENVRFLKNGWARWREKGLPVE